MEELPSLPGNHFPDITRTHFIVPRTLSFKNGHRIVQAPRFGIGQIDQQNSRLTDEERQLLDNFPPELIYGQVRVQEARRFIPATIFYDKKILRFDGYFKQTIYESPLEHYRVRRVIIYYYLEDDTIAVYEVPSKNSALVQGMRVRRHRIQKTDQNDFYNWRDLNLGENISIYGTVYRLCDCDQFTKEWLESEGIELKCSELIPSDPYTVKVLEKQRSGSSDLKDILPDLMTKEPAIGNKLFLSLDGKVLRFYAVFTDQQQTQQCWDTSRKFIIHFYLVDNTIEIREIHQLNDGYDPISTYLHRQMIPKDSTYNIKSFVNLFVNKREQEKICYLKPEDLLLGHSINIFNRLFFLYDCDACTKDFYHENFSHYDLTPVDIDAKRRQTRTSRLPSIPPHTQQNVKNLISKSSGKKFPINDQNRLLRYEAVMDSPGENNDRRRFLIVYRLTDDLISVYEKPLDGYGCLTRKFLERSQIPKPDSSPDTPVYYEPNDLYIGARIELFKHRFTIIDADRYVGKFIEENQQYFSQHVIDSFRKHTHQDKSKDLFNQIYMRIRTDDRLSILSRLRMKGVFLSLLFFCMCLSGALSSPTPTQPKAEASCPPYGCIVDTSLCFCGSIQTPDDRCCAATCAPCPPDFTVKPWLTIDWSSINWDGFNLPILGKK